MSCSTIVSGTPSKDLAVNSLSSNRHNTKLLVACTASFIQATVDDAVIGSLIVDTINGGPYPPPGTAICTGLGELTVGAGGSSIMCLPIGIVGQVLTVSGGGLPTWMTPVSVCTGSQELTVGDGVGGVTCLGPPATSDSILRYDGATVNWFPRGASASQSILSLSGTSLRWFAPGASGSLLRTVVGPTLDWLPIGLAGQVLTVSAGLPTWVTPITVCTGIQALTVGDGVGGVTCLGPPATSDSILRYDGATVNWFPRGASASQSILSLSGTSLGWFAPGASGSLLRTVVGPTLDWLPIGVAGQVLTVSAGLPTWVTPVAVCTGAQTLTVGDGVGGVTCLGPPATADSILRYDGATVNWFPRGASVSQSILSLSGTSLGWFGPGASGSLLRTVVGPTLDWLPIGLAGQVLTVSAGLPAWVTVGQGQLNSIRLQTNGVVAFAATPGTSVTWGASLLSGPSPATDYTFASPTLTINTTGSYLMECTLVAVRTGGAAATTNANVQFRNDTAATLLDPVTHLAPQSGGAAGSVTARGTITFSTIVSAVAGQAFTVRGILGTVGTVSTVAATSTWLVVRLS